MLRAQKISPVPERKCRARRSASRPPRISTPHGCSRPSPPCRRWMAATPAKVARAAAAAERIRLDAPAGAGRDRAGSSRCRTPASPSSSPSAGRRARHAARPGACDFSEADALAIKDIERTTNHDVKAVEYWLKGRFEARPKLQGGGSEFVHFACTSEDINNTSHALMLKARARRGDAAGARRAHRRACASMAHALADGADAQPHPRPDRQPDHASARKSPTSVARLGARAKRIAAVQAAGQDERRGRQLQRAPRGLAGLRLGSLRAPGRRDSSLGLSFNPYTIQIEPHDCMAELFDARGPHQHHPDRLVARHLGLRQPGLLQAAPARRARSAPRRCRTRSTRSTSRTPRATSGWPTRC